MRAAETLHSGAVSCDPHCGSRELEEALGGSSRLVYISQWLRIMVKNHGDRKSPKDRVTPLPNGLSMACKWGVILTTY